MSRSVPWRRVCPEKVAKRIERACRAQIYLLRTTGPTGFLLTAEGDERKFKVFLGDPHTCTCPVFLKEKDLCLHILWVLVKKLRVPKENAVIYQLGLVEREIGEVVRGIFTESASNTSQASNNSNCRKQEMECREKLSKKEITEDDVCPICQEDLIGNTQPTTYCKYGCGNSVHIKCMKVWADHQKSSGETIIKCPLCRVDFGSFEILKKEYLKSSRYKQRRPEIHQGTVCSQCEMSPISGECYRCNICSNYQLCKECFRTNSHAVHHPFVFRQKSNQRWRATSLYQAIPLAVANDLQSREISENDYTLLLQLDGSSTGASSVPSHILNSFPVEKITSNNHRLVVDGSKCGVCYQQFQLSQIVRKLPCKHEFHRHCIDPWLSRDHNTCPTDGRPVNIAYNKPTSSNSISSDQQNPRTVRSISKKILPMSTKIRKTQPKEQDCLPQDFSLYGSAFAHDREINHNERTSSSSNVQRINSAPAAVVEIHQSPASNSSKHITFDNNIVGHAHVSTQQVMRYGRHSGDSRFRRRNGLSNTSKSTTTRIKQISTDMALSGRAISTCTSSNASMNDRTLHQEQQENTTEHQFNIMRTSIVPSSPHINFNNVPVDI